MAKLTRQTFQHGSLTTEKRKNGEQIWVFRWRESGSDGKRVRRKAIVGTLKELPTKAKAETAVAGLRLDITKEQPARLKGAISVRELAAHYQSTELDEKNSTKAFSTRECYRGMIEQYIVPRWGDYLLGDVRTIAVESWLGELSLSNGSKTKIRGVFHALYSHAQRYEWHDANPITKVRQSTQREKEPDILEPGELTRLLEALPEPFKTMAFTAAVTGLRRGELIGLKWQDVDFDAGLIRPVRSVVCQNVGKLKTAASARPVGLDPNLAEALTNLRANSPFNKPEDWVFASPESAGERPYWPDSVLTRRLQPTARRLGITKAIGWHTFRRSYASLLLSSGADVKVCQESLRHANVRITLGLYAQSFAEDKRTAQSKVVQMILPQAAQPLAKAG